MARAKKADPVDYAAKAAKLKAEKAKAQQPEEKHQCCGGDCERSDTSALAAECRDSATSARRSVEMGCYSAAAVRRWADVMLRAAEALG